MTYAFYNFPTNDLTEAEVRQEIANAFKFWSDVTPLKFTEATKTEGDDQADIRIGFFSGKHLNERNPRDEFDGPGTVAAHAISPSYFFYYNQRQYKCYGTPDTAGDVHFDDAETWTLTGYEGAKTAE